MANAVPIWKSHRCADLDCSHIRHKLFVSLFDHCLLLFERNDRLIWFCINDGVGNECALAVFHCNMEGASLGSATQNPNRKKDEWPEAHYSV